MDFEFHSGISSMPVMSKKINNKISQVMKISCCERQHSYASKCDINSTWLYWIESFNDIYLS